MKKIYNSYCFLVEIGAKYSNILSRVKRHAFILPKTHLHAVLCTLTLACVAGRVARERKGGIGLGGEEEGTACKDAIVFFVFLRPPDERKNPD